MTELYEVLHVNFLSNVAGIWQGKKANDIDMRYISLTRRVTVPLYAVWCIL